MNPMLRNCRVDVANRRIYYVRTLLTRSCKFYANDESSRLEYYFYLKDIRYLKGNNAPRGGRLGNYYTFNNETFFKLIHNEQ